MLSEMTRTTDPEEIKRKLEGEIQPEEEEAKITEDQKFQRRYGFKIDHLTTNGRRYAGNFVNQILRFQDRSRVGAMRASMQMGLNADSFDEETTNLNAMISHMTISLVERPEWAKNLANLDDVSLLEALWTEVQAHEATFHGPRPKKEAGESKGKDE